LNRINSDITLQKKAAGSTCNGRNIIDNVASFSACLSMRFILV